MTDERSGAKSRAGSGGIGSASLLMASGTLVSRVLGFVRNMLLIAVIGVTTSGANAFDVANKLPNILNMIIAGGLMNAVLVPQIVRAAKNKDGGREYTDKLLTFAGFVLFLLTALLTVCAPFFTKLFTDNPANDELTTAFAVWCIPQLFFYGMYTLLGQVLNARGSFGPYMWAPALNNIVAIAGLTVFFIAFGTGGKTENLDWWNSESIALLAGSATAGIACQALILIPALRKSGFRWSLRFGVRGVGLGTTGRVAGWTLAALVVSQLGYVALSRVASAASEANMLNAGNAAYTNAFMIFMLPHSLITISLVTALFTRLSHSAADNNIVRVRKDLSLGMRTVGMFTIIISMVMIVLAFPLTRALLGPRAETHAVGETADVVSMMTLGLTAIGFWSVSQRFFYAFEDTRTLFFIQVPMAVIVAGGSYLGMLFMPARSWVEVIGFSQACSNVFGAVVALWIIRRRIASIDGYRVLRVLVRAMIAAMFATVGGLVVLRLFGDLYEIPWVMNCLIVVIVASVMVGIYAVGLRVMHVYEFTDAIKRFTRKLSRRRG